MVNVTQLVECLSVEEDVMGSSPIVHTRNAPVVELAVTTDLRSVAQSGVSVRVRPGVHLHL